MNKTKTDIKENPLCALIKKVWSLIKKVWSWFLILFWYSPSEVKNKLEKMHAGKPAAANNQKDKKSVIADSKDKDNRFWIFLIACGFVSVIAALVIFSVSSRLDHNIVLCKKTILKGIGEGIGVTCTVYVGFLIPAVLSSKRIKNVEAFLSYERARVVSLMLSLIIGFLASLPVFFVFNEPDATLQLKVFKVLPFASILLFVLTVTAYVLIYALPGGHDVFYKKYRLEYVQYRLSQLAPKTNSNGAGLKWFCRISKLIYFIATCALTVLICYGENIPDTFTWAFILFLVMLLVFLGSFFTIYSVVEYLLASLVLLTLFVLVGLMLIFVLNYNSDTWPFSAILLIIVAVGTLFNRNQLSRVYKRHNLEVELEWLKAEDKRREETNF